MKKVALHTLGCKLNYTETSTIGSDFKSRGFSISDFDSKADVYVINTCTVTDNAERECRQVVRRALRSNPKGFVIVTGCYAQLRPADLQKIEGVDLILGSNEKFEIFNFIDNLEKKNLACIHTTPTESFQDFGPAFSNKDDDRTRAFLKIQDGCNYSCTFCTIPQARGESRSLPIDGSAKQFQNLIFQGFREIVLTGVNVGDYGSKLNTDLTQLVRRLLKTEGDYRIRFSSIEPNLLTDEIIRLVRNEEKLCSHFHIPLQSGSDLILKQMRRRYLSELYQNRIEQVKSLIPDCGIGVDVIVGFPGETEHDFELTYKLLNEMPISYLHVFTYSERPGTPAAEMINQIPKNIRKERTNRLRILSAKKKHLFYSDMIGKKERVLFEHPDEDNAFKGFSSNYVRVIHKPDVDLTNKLTEFMITGIQNEYCIGELPLNLN